MSGGFVAFLVVVNGGAGLSGMVGLGLVGGLLMAARYVGRSYLGKRYHWFYGFMC